MRVAVVEWRRVNMLVSLLKAGGVGREDAIGSVMARERYMALSIELQY